MVHQALKDIGADDPSDLGPDITDCDREPIHVPGAIQPHGLLLVVRASDLVVVGAAGDIEGRAFPQWLDRPLAELIGAPSVARLQAVDGEAADIVLDRLETGDETFEVVAHRGAAHVLVEFEPARARAPTALETLALLDRYGGGFERAADLTSLCEAAALAFRQITGFDRVMVYRFLDDDAGVVVAEDRAEGQGSFLNHHFPASDIPQQARALYIRNRVRAIPDVAYTPAPLRPDTRGLHAVDLSDSQLRSVSPIHVQYLKNMGVAASASVSIVKDGVLWGLIACHHQAPRALPFAARTACRVLAGGLARQIRAKEDAELYRERLRLRASEDAAVARLGADLSLQSLREGAADEMRQMLAADGFAAVQGGEVLLTGACPDEEDVRDLARWVAPRAPNTPFQTASLGAQNPAARAYADLGSGLLAVTLGQEDPLILMWLRAEAVQLVEWAGNPHKAVNAAPGGALTPRASFEAWSDEVRGRARPWTLVEVEAAQRLRRSLSEARQNRRVRELNRELSTSLTERDSLLEQKDYLIKEVNHRVQNSLQLVAAFLALQARDAQDAALSGHLAEAQRRLSAVALVHRRLYADDASEVVDLSRYLEELCGELKASLGPEWAAGMTVDLAPILMQADRAVNLGLILTELVINATKYAYAGEPGPIAVTLEQVRNRLRLIVADKGRGRTGDRVGFGSRMMANMVDRIDGRLEETRGEPGLRIVVTAPV